MCFLFRVILLTIRFIFYLFFFASSLRGRISSVFKRRDRPFSADQWDGRKSFSRGCGSARDTLMSKRAILFWWRWGFGQRTLAYGCEGKGPKCACVCIYIYMYVNIYIYTTWECVWVYVCRIAPIKPYSRSAGAEKGQLYFIGILHTVTRARARAHTLAPVEGMAERFSGTRWRAERSGGWRDGRTFVCARLFPVPSRKRKTGYMFRRDWRGVCGGGLRPCAGMSAKRIM